MLPVTAEVMDLARSLLDSHRAILARDALHAAAFRLSGADALVSFDGDFDRIEGVRRREPSKLLS